MFVAAVLLGSPGIRGRGAWRNESAALSPFFVFGLVGVGARTATAQNSAMAIAAGLILAMILVFIRLYLFLREILACVAKN